MRGTKRLLSVAGVRIALIGHASDAAMLDARYAPFFVAPSSAPVAAVLELDLHEPAQQPWSSESLEVVETAHHFALSARSFEAKISRDGTRATLRAPRLERCVDAVLRYMLSRTLLTTGGLLLHASAVVLEDRHAWIFAGASGVGKTTISEQLVGRVLGDEAVAVRIESGGLVCHSTPYWTATPSSAPVAGLVFPSQGPQNQCLAISPARALAKLLSCVGPLLPSAQASVLRLTEQVVQVSEVQLLDVVLNSIEAIPRYLHPIIVRLSPPMDAIE